MGLLVSEIGEFGLIERLGMLEVVRGIGDDCAVTTPPPGHDLVMTADALIEGVHFRHEWTDWFSLGWKSVAVNLSDLAAMGARPSGLVVTLGLRRDAVSEDVERFYRGAEPLCRPNGVYFRGGDIVSSPLATAISVTAYGYVLTGRAILRSGARPGDELWVTGDLGAAAAGLRSFMEHMDARTEQTSEREVTPLPGRLRYRHDHPVPRLRQGCAIAEAGLVHAMLDISDGLAGDLGHMMAASGVGAVIEEESLPISPDVREAAETWGWDTVEMALHGGEDYELLMAVPPESSEAFQATIAEANRRAAYPCSLTKPATRIGSIVEGNGITLRRADGAEEPLAAKAFTHF